MADPQSNRPNTNNRFRPDSTAFFRAANFELFVKPNKYVMSIGVISFSLCIFYFYQWNRQVRQQSITTSTYVAINEDNTETIRSRKSRWD
ncbi:Small integral membrane protein 8 [Dermatophagoides farinae]|uniref:Small integral membrane protein 8 n=1 Tax=Dermatophagoides farinae TaxID=6954 RepID=A0A922IC26_DERFA|nr:Small integral membrane protein 8 [Dermatophagoides farinae]